MFKNINTESGLIKLIVIIIIAIIVLSYFGFDLRAIVEAPETQGNLGYVWGLVVHVWDTYLVGPATYLWNDVFIDLLWNTFIENMDRMKAGQPTTMEEMAPTITIE